MDAGSKVRDWGGIQFISPANYCRRNATGYVPNVVNDFSMVSAVAVGSNCKI